MNEIVRLIALAISVIVAVSLLLAFPVMWLWNNALVGAINGVNEIGFWQALGILILSGFLFKNTSASKK